MRDFIKGLVLGVLLVAMIIIFAKAYIKCGEYTLDGTITMVCNNHWVEVTTDDGNVWEFDSYDFHEGQRVRVTFMDMDTVSQVDDEIIEVVDLREADNSR